MLDKDQLERNLYRWVTGDCPKGAISLCENLKTCGIDIEDVNNRVKELVRKIVAETIAKQSGGEDAFFSEVQRLEDKIDEG